jgi:hypothetical protein
VIKHYQANVDNTPMSTYLTLKTGGGSKRLGLGRGIHWHIENVVLYLPLDEQEQQIPYVQVTKDDGTVDAYLDLESSLDPEIIDPDELERMDCTTCHNRITHLIYQPETMLDQLMNRGIVSPDIPEIKRKGVEAFHGTYANKELALKSIGALDDFYRVHYPDFYAANQEKIQQAVEALQDAYASSVFPEQKASWDSHPNNVGHQDSPGCFRCHDGKHLNEKNEAIRLECNLCHSIPVVAGPSDFVAEIEISRGPEPQSHLNPNWISLHREVFDTTCVNCHTTDDPGGTSNTSFCSNSACHGSVYQFAGFDAPGLREILREQIPTPEALPTPPEAELTFNLVVGPMLEARCGSCHGEGGLEGLDLTSYSGVLQGGESGPAVIPGEPEGSLLIQKLSADQPHFVQLQDQELELVREWIEMGAPED